MNVATLVKEDITAHRADEIYNMLRKALSVSEEDIKDMYIFYDSDVYAYDNDIYKDIEMRFVQYLHSNKKGSWHGKKHAIISDWLGDINSDIIVDVGYGIIQKYHIEKIKKGWAGKFYMLEKYESAEIFSKEYVRRVLGKKFEKNFQFIRFDMDYSDLSNVPSADTYIFLDSLEHAREPASCLHKFINHAAPESLFIFSLPIGEIVPVHSISWENAQELRQWIRSFGFNIIRERHIFPNPEVDTFVNSLQQEFSNLLLMCSMQK